MGRSVSAAEVLFAFLLGCLGTISVDAAKPIEPRGVLAMSSGDRVVLIDPGSESVQSLETGPVGFLFPAPAGILFAPDVLNDRTSVIDVNSGRVVELMSGVTMPHFGPWKDRYLVVAGALTMVSFPERSLIFRIEGEFNRPWQVQLGPEGTTVIVLERMPSGKDGTTISAVDLMHRRVVYSKPFDHDLERFFMAPEAGVMAVVDRTTGDIVLLDTLTLAEIRRLPVPGGATDVVAFSEGKTLIAAGTDGRLLRWKLKVKKDVLSAEPEDPILIPGRTLRLAVGPDDRLVAAATDRGRLIVLDPKKDKEIRQWEIPASFRDFRWIDSDQAGPLLPSWSDSGFGPEGAKLGPDKRN